MLTQTSNNRDIFGSVLVLVITSGVNRRRKVMGHVLTVDVHRNKFLPAKARVRYVQASVVLV